MCLHRIMRQPVVYTYRVSAPDAHSDAPDAHSDPDDTEPPVVPGYLLLDLLGAGAHGQVWRAQQEGSRQEVAVKLVQRPESGAARQELTVLGRMRHPHLIRLREWRRAADGRLALVTDLVSGPTLQDLVTGRGALTPGEVVTVLIPLAQALDHVHGRSLVHGDISAGNVMFDADGRPLLIDLGVASLLGWQRAEDATAGFADPSTTAQGRHEPAGDVYSLAALAWFALTGQVPQGPGLRPPLLTLAPQVPLELADLLDAALSADPADRPAPGEVAVRAYQACPAEPIRLVDPQAAPERALTQRLRRRADSAPVPDEEPRSRPRHRPGTRAGAAAPAWARRSGPGRGVSRRRRTWSLVTLSGFVLGAVLAFWPGFEALTSPLTGQRSASAVAVGPVHEPAPEAAGRDRVQETTAPVSPLHAALAGEDPVAAVRAASELRAMAFGTATQAPLELVGAAGSSALEADLRTLAQLQEQRTRLDGLGFEISETTLLSLAGTAAQVQVTVATSGHRVVGTDDGQLRAEVPASPPATLVLTLERQDGQWRISSVTTP